MVHRLAGAADSDRRRMDAGASGARGRFGTAGILLRFPFRGISSGQFAHKSRAISRGSVATQKLALNGVRAYNGSMARGWESKSVEAQIDMAASSRAAAPAKKLTPEALAQVRKKESLTLSRTRVVREMESAQNPRYRAVLCKALADLDAQLRTLK